MAGRPTASAPRTSAFGSSPTIHAASAPVTASSTPSKARGWGFSYPLWAELKIWVTCPSRPRSWKSWSIPVRGSRGSGASSRARRACARRVPRRRRAANGEGPSMHHEPHPPVLLRWMGPALRLRRLQRRRAGGRPTTSWARRAQGEGFPGCAREIPRAGARPEVLCPRLGPASLLPARCAARRLSAPHGTRVSRQSPRSRTARWDYLVPIRGRQPFRGRVVADSLWVNFSVYARSRRRGRVEVWVHR